MNLKKHAFIISLCATFLMSISSAWAGEETENPDTADIQQQVHNLVQKLVGTYDNSRQYEQADDTLKIAPRTAMTKGLPWLDHKYAVFKQVDAPAVKGTVVALEWRKASADGEVTRQRLWAFRHDGANMVMDFYSLRNPIEFSAPEAFRTLTAEDLISYGDKCALPVTVKPDGAYHLAIPDTCRIISRSGRDMTLSTEITVSDTLTYKESGNLIDGTPVFEVPGGQPYEFVRRGQ